MDVAAGHEPADHQHPGRDARAAQRRVQVQPVGPQRAGREGQRADDGQRTHRRQAGDQQRASRPRARPCPAGPARRCRPRAPRSTPSPAGRPPPRPAGSEWLARSGRRRPVRGRRPRAARTRPRPSRRRPGDGRGHADHRRRPARSHPPRAGWPPARRDGPRCARPARPDVPPGRSGARSPCRGPVRRRGRERARWLMGASGILLIVLPLGTGSTIGAPRPEDKKALLCPLRTRDVRAPRHLEWRSPSGLASASIG